MRRVAAVLAILAILFAPLPAASSAPLESTQVSFRVLEEPLARDVPHIGINLGSRTNWGAEQFMANALSNPGFEPTIDGALVVVKQASGVEFTDDTTWLKRPDHFWANATFSIRTGKLAGAEGSIVDSDSRQNFPHFSAARDLTGLATGDVIALSQTRREDLPSGWWWENESRGRIRVDSDRPAHSKGTQSICLAPDSPQPIAALSYLDLIGDRAGKLLPLNGTWEVRFWAKGDGRAQLRLQLRRLNRPPMVRQAVTLSAEWNEYRFRFAPNDFGPPSNLEFRLEVEGAGGRVWLDDVSLAPLYSSDSGFRREVIETLRLMQPGYLRDWQGQLGDTFANRIAADEARRPSRYRPGDERQYAYSLPQFFALCRAVGAQPWIVLPTTLRDQEWRAAGEYLHRAADDYGFHEIVVEFGNENWNAIFRPAGIMSAPRLAEAAQRGFRLLKAASGDDRRLLPALGAQFVDSRLLAAAIAAAPDANMMAIAPYYGYSLPRADRLADTLTLLFPNDRELTQQWRQAAKTSGRQLAVYELNAHSAAGAADPDDVSRVVASSAAGSALLYRAILALEGGAWRQCLYSFAGFDTFRGDKKLIRLFGLTRDLATVGRLRPTGLAMQLANLAWRGETYQVAAESGSAQQDVAIAAFKHNNRWSLVAASASSREIEITVQLPRSGALPNTLVRLESSSPLANNEILEQVKLRSTPLAMRGHSLTFRLAPYGSAAAVYEEVPARRARR